MPSFSSYSFSFSFCFWSVFIAFWVCLHFVLFSPPSAAFLFFSLRSSINCCNRPESIASVCESSSSGALSWAIPSSIWSSTYLMFSSNLTLFFSVVFFHTKVYLLATDSIFVPSIYCTSRLTCPSSTSTLTTCINRLLMQSFIRSERKRLIVEKDGYWRALSHIYRISHCKTCSIFLHE